MSSYQKETLISVDEAITKGKHMLLLPRILMIFGLFFFMFPIAMILIAIFEGPPFTTNIWLICAGIVLFCFLVCFYLPFLYWSKTTTRWKLWAFDNVDDVHELKIMAAQASLCAPPGSVIDRIQIQSATEREQWLKLQERFDFHPSFKDDPDIPYTTEVYYSKWHLMLSIIWGLLFVGIGSVIEYLAINNNGQLSLKIVAALIAVAPVYMIIVALKRMFKKQPELVLDNQGFYSKRSGFINWDLIFNERVVKTYQGRSGVKFTLSIQHPGGIVTIDITQFNVGKSRLERLFRVYKGRYAAGIR